MMVSISMKPKREIFDWGKVIIMMAIPFLIVGNTILALWTISIGLLVVSTSIKSEKERFSRE